MTAKKEHSRLSYIVSLAASGIKIIFKLLSLTYKALNDFAPKYLSDLIDIYVPECNLRSAQSQQLVQPAYNLRTHGFRALFMHFYSLYHEIKFSSSLKSF